MAELLSPRAVRSDTPLGRLLLAMEVPDCRCGGLVCLAGEEGYPARCPGEGNCKFCLRAPCRHVAESDHSLSLQEWSELLQHYDPDGYSDPPLPASPAAVLTREASVAVLIQRAHDGEALRHPRDLWRVAHRGEDMGVEKLAIGSERGKWQADVIDAAELDEAGDGPTEEDRARLRDPNPDAVTLRAIRFDQLAAQAEQKNRESAQRKQREGS